MESLRTAASGCALLALAACGAISADRSDAPDLARLGRGGLGEARLDALAASIGPAGARLAGRFDPLRHADAWDRSAAWATLDLAKAPQLPFQVKGPDDAEALNAFLPAAGGPITPAAPFFLPASGPERERAVLCLTQAVYYEAGTQPLAGEEAVAQTVLNRVRHPDFPKSVCGVVYQGSSVPLGCQFTFTCDGSLARAPMAPYWDRARAVAEAALGGFVQKDVGSATSYHADYVFPRWGPLMVKIGQIGAHIFYRFPGPLGRADALNGRYAGGELKVSLATPSLAAIAAARAAGAGEGGTPAETVAEAAPPPTSPTDMRPRVAGQIVFGRRIPSRDEIAAINARLAKLAGDAPDAPVPSVTPPAP